MSGNKVQFKGLKCTSAPGLRPIRSKCQWLKTKFSWSRFASSQAQMTHHSSVQFPKTLKIRKMAIFPATYQVSPPLWLPQATVTALHLFPISSTWYDYIPQQLPWVPEDPGIKALRKMGGDVFGLLPGQYMLSRCHWYRVHLPPTAFPPHVGMLVCYSSNSVDSCFSHDRSGY